MTAGTVVMNRNDRIFVHFGKRPDGVVGAFLHFRVGPLNRVQLNRIFILSGGYRRHGASPHSNAVVISTQQHDLVAFSGIPLHRIFLPAKANSAGQHNYLIISVLFPVFHMLKRQYGS